MKVFNRLVVKGEYTAKITPATGLFIETWVRKPDEIEKSLAMFAKTVATCNQEYIAKIEARIKASENTREKSSDDSEQVRLNNIIAALNFEE